MNILLIGDDGRSERLFTKLAQGHSVTHCADGAAALTQLATGETQYDWIVVEGMARTLSSMEIASAIRAMGIWAPIAFLCDADQLDFAQQAAGMQKRVVNGSHYASPSPARWPYGATTRTGEIVLEYHAPIKRRKGRY